MQTPNPRSFDHLAEEYDFVASLERNPDFFLKNLPRNTRTLLDLGCGTGILAHDLAPHVQSILALDISEPMLAIARAKRPAPNIQYQFADADHLTLPHKFDAIVSHSTFHHLADIPRTLETLKQSLNPAGRLIFIDNVARLSLIPRRPFIMRARALLKLLPDSLHRGPKTARRILRFRTSRHWLNHLQTDHHLPPKQFRDFYSKLLPGISFTPLKYFLGAVWQSPLHPTQNYEPAPPVTPSTNAQINSVWPHPSSNVKSLQ